MHWFDKRCLDFRETKAFATWIGWILISSLSSCMIKLSKIDLEKKLSTLCRYLHGFGKNSRRDMSKVGGIGCQIAVSRRLNLMIRTHRQIVLQSVLRTDIHHFVLDRLSKINLSAIIRLTKCFRWNLSVVFRLEDDWGRIPRSFLNICVCLRLQVVDRCTLDIENWNVSLQKPVTVWNDQRLIFISTVEQITNKLRRERKSR